MTEKSAGKVVWAAALLAAEVPFAVFGDVVRVPMETLSVLNVPLAAWAGVAKVTLAAPERGAEPPRSP